jgi:hypothetical protein
VRPRRQDPAEIGLRVHELSRLEATAADQLDRLLHVTRVGGVVEKQVEGLIEQAGHPRVAYGVVDVRAFAAHPHEVLRAEQGEVLGDVHYFLLGGAIARFHLLRYGLALILVFVGLKMAWLDHLYGGKFPIGLSLGIIATLIAGGIGLSLVVAPRSQSGRSLPPGRASAGAG